MLPVLPAEGVALSEEGREDPTRPDEALLSGAEDLEDSTRPDEALLSGAEDRVALPEVDALSGVADRDDCTLLSEYPLEPELLLEEVTVREGRLLQCEV